MGQERNCQVKNDGALREWHKNGIKNEVRGILLPHGGPSLEDLAGGHLYGMRILGVTCEDLNELINEIPAHSLPAFPENPGKEYQFAGPRPGSLGNKQGRVACARRPSMTRNI
jgi:hypothetical protein